MTSNNFLSGFFSKKDKNKDPLKEDTKLGSGDALTIYCHLLYITLGRFLLQKKKFKDFFKKSIYNRKYEEILKKANLKLVPEEYLLSVFLTIIMTLFFFIFLSLIFFTINIIYSFLLFFGGLVAVFAVGVFLYNYPIIIAKTRGDQIDASMIYLLPYLKILSDEISLSKMVELIDEFLIYKEIKVEFNKIKYYSNFLGYDIHSSIREAMLSCPSKQLSDLMNDMVTISNSGGNIHSYLERKLNNLNSEIEAEEKKNIDTLLIYSQIYIVLLLIAPLFFTIMVAVLDIIDFSTASQTSAASGGSILNIIVMMFFLPLVYIGFMMLIYYSKPLYTRLVPMKNAKK